MKYIDILEARVPGLDYQEVIKNKKTDPKIDKVILKLESTNSAIMTKIANRYKRLDNIKKAMESRRNEMNAYVKEQMVSLFDAEDVYYTRVIKTVSATMTLAKLGESTPASTKEVKDWEKIANELLSLMDTELLEKGNEIIKKYTEIKKIPAMEPKSPSLTIDTEADLTESVSWSKLKSWGSKFLDYFKSWGRSYDTKLANIVGQMDAIS